jgi:hypothetical protein
MFGISAFAQSPFASLAGTDIILSIIEDIGVDDSSTQLSTFLQSITEPIGVSDVENDAGGNFFGSVTETITLDDSSTQASTFLQDITEDLLPADTPTIAADFSVSRAEAHHY